MDYGLLEYKEYDFGHGVGADTPEHPRLLYGTGRVIEAGMVLAVQCWWLKQARMNLWQEQIRAEKC